MFLLKDPNNHTVRASMFFYKDSPELVQAAPGFSAHCKAAAWWLICWDEKRSQETWRAYNVTTG